GTTLGGWIGQLIVAAAGACVLIYVVRLVRGLV
ncbi:GlsB/YeaQ/YmgE family stress response membrane protein, partial [Roseobacter litoralis]